MSETYHNTAGDGVFSRPYEPRPLLLPGPRPRDDQLRVRKLSTNDTTDNSSPCNLVRVKQEVVTTMELIPERVKIEPEESLEYYYTPPSGGGILLPHHYPLGQFSPHHHNHSPPQRSLSAISPSSPLPLSVRRHSLSSSYPRPPEDGYVAASSFTAAAAALRDATAATREGGRCDLPPPAAELHHHPGQHHRFLHPCRGDDLTLHLKQEVREEQAHRGQGDEQEAGVQLPPQSPAPLEEQQQQQPEEQEEEGADYRDRSEIGSSRTVIEFDGNDCVLCRVCGDKASGFHYGVHSCEGCKGFFRRSIQQKIQYRPCSKNQQCSILRINRNRCQYCRLKKCIAAGMSRDAVRFGRVPKREKAKILAAMQTSRNKSLESRVMADMADESKMIETIVRAHYDTCDYTADKIQPFLARAQAQQLQTHCTGLTCPMKGRPEQSFLDQFSERFMDHVRQVCTFAKSIPGFKCLHHEDQVSLLKSCVFEVLLVRLSGLFNNQSLVCLNGDVIRRETISAMPAGNAKFLMDSVFELAQRINRFRLSDAEIGLFCSVVIITADRPGLRNPELVGRMQSKLKLVLQNILVPQHPQHSAIFSQLLTIVHDLRTLNTLHTEKFLQQAKVGPPPPPPAASPVGGETTSPASPHHHLSHLHHHLHAAGSTSLVGLYERADWDEAVDRDSTGSRSPQSSSDSSSSSSQGPAGGLLLGHHHHHNSSSSISSSYNSMEDLRRSPIGSVSSSESLGSSETFSKLSVNDLKIHGVGSVLLNALTSPALSQLGGGGCPALSQRKRDISRLSSSCEMPADEATAASLSSSQYADSHQKLAAAAGQGTLASATTTATAASAPSCPFKTRKLDSPSDSGIDSPKAQGSQSTNTSVCSSPRSSLEEATCREAGEEDSRPAGSSSSSSLLEDQHPLLKRALQQPPQPFNLGVTGFQDEVYKPHKKFRHSGRKEGDNNEPTSTQQESAPSPQPAHSASSAPSPLVLTHSILASQLAAPPSYSQPLGQRRSSPTPPHSQSLLASTLSRPLSVPRPRREEERNELLATLILDGGRYRTGSTNKPQTLLMCAPSHQQQQHIPGEGWSRSSSPAAAASGRHLPVPVAPCQPTSTQASPRPLARQELPKGVVASPSSSSHLRSALTDPSSTSSSSSHLRSALTDPSPQPLNLSTRTPPPSSSSNIKAEA